MERFGLVGLPNAGKSSLFNALTNAGALAAPYAFATKEPNVGMSKVLDHRLDALAAMSKSKNVVPATVQFVDIGGLVEGASKGEGLGNRFLGDIREVDAIVFVLRAFADDDVPGPDDPLEHLRIVEIELALADLETVEGQLNRTQKAARADRSLADEVAALDAAYKALSDGTPIYRAGFDARDARAAPALLPPHQQAGAGGRERGRGPARRHRRRSRPRWRPSSPGADVLGMCVQLEAEAIQLDAADRAEMLEALGLGEGALPRFVRRRLPPARPAHVLHDRGEGEPGVDVPRRLQGARVRRRHPHRLPAGLHPGRGHPLGRAARARVVEQGQGRRQAAGRGQGLRGRRRRRHGDPLQRVVGVC